jgi:hypothetical protein
MFYTKGTATGFDDLITKIINWATDNTIHGDDAWSLVRNEAWPRGTILKAHGRLAGEFFYVGLLPNTIIKNKTYMDWLLRKKNIATYYVWNQKGLDMNGKDFIIDTSKLAIFIDDLKYSFTEIPDIFTNSAQVMHLGIFKQYSENLDWHEQSGGMDFIDLPMRPIQYMRPNSKTKSDFVPPALPGVGYPTLSIDYGGLVDGTMNYWLVKDRHRLIIVVNNAGYWDSAYLGFFEPYDNDEYAFPAVVIGGTSGLIQEGIDVFYSSEQETPSTVIGLKVDYSPDNWNLTHGIAPFAGAAIDDKSCPSQTMLMLPDGRWQSFANYVQGLEAIAKHVESGPIKEHVYMRTEPTRPSNIKHFIRPTENDLIDFYHVLTEDEKSYIYKLEPIEFLEADSDRQNLLGRLPYMFYPSQSIIRYGEITINNKKYLMLPNCWQDRSFHLEGHAGIVYDTDTDVLLTKNQNISKVSKTMNLLIRLEE